MLIKDGSVWTWRATIRVNSFDLDGNLIDVVEFPNLITNVGKNLVRDSFDGGVTDLAIKYMGWGTSSTAPAAGQTTLVAESGRKAVTSQADGAAGIIDTTVYLGPDDANVAIEELGWFSGSAASATADSGAMIARTLYSKNKTNLESVSVVRTDTWS